MFRHKNIIHGKLKYFSFISPIQHIMGRGNYKTALKLVKN